MGDGKKSLSAKGAEDAQRRITASTPSLS